MESHGKSGFGAYVLSLEKRLYVFNHLDKLDRITHSSFVRGAPVLSAGELRILDGTLMALTSHSGHYRPDLMAVQGVLTWLSSQGATLSRPVVYFVVDPKLDLTPIHVERQPWIFPADPGRLRVIRELLVPTSDPMKALKADVVSDTGFGKYVYAATQLMSYLRTRDDPPIDDSFFPSVPVRRLDS
jgi:hypothetical protein